MLERMQGYGMTDQEREREKKKSRLRSRMLVTEADTEGEALDADRDGDEDGYRQRLIRHRIKKVIFSAVPLILIAAGVFYLYYRSRNRTYTEYEVAWTKDLPENEFSSYAEYAAGVLKYGRDGASYVNASGETVWSQAYEMRSPIAAVNGPYAVVADQEGNSIYIFDETGCQGSVTTTLPITNVTIAGQGMVAAILEEGDVSYINFFDRAGGRLDIELRLWMGGQGYPIALSLSPSGTQLMLSCIYADAGSMQNNIAFYNFSEVGEVLDQRLAGAFPTGGTVCPEVAFLSDTRACAFLDNGVAFYSMEELSASEPLLPEQGPSYTYEEEIRSVFYNENYVGIVTEGNGQDEPYQLHVYNASGEIVQEFGVDFDYMTAQFSDYGICFYDQAQWCMYGFNGVLRYQGELGGTLGIVTHLSQSRLLRVGDQTVSEVRLR